METEGSSRVPDGSSLSPEPTRELTEVATDAQLKERNGRLLVQVGGRYLVRTPCMPRRCPACAQAILPVLSGSRCAWRGCLRYRRHLLSHGRPTASRGHRGLRRVRSVCCVPVASLPNQSSHRRQSLSEYERRDMQQGPEAACARGGTARWQDYGAFSLRQRQHGV